LQIAAVLPKETGDPSGGIVMIEMLPAKTAGRTRYTFL
jgi:hypothetical protein